MLCAACECFKWQCDFLPACEVIDEGCFKAFGGVGGLIDAHVIDECVLRHGHAIVHGAAKVTAEPSSREARRRGRCW